MGFVYKHVTVEQRVQVGLLAKCYQGVHGVVTDLAQALGTSRKFIYEVRDRVVTAAMAELAPRAPGPVPAEHSIVVDRARLDRAILTLGLAAHASERAIEVCLNEMYEVNPSLGHINGVLGRASKAAAEFNEGLPLVLKEAQLEADEVFAAGKANLVAVDHHSLLILAQRQPERGDGEAWRQTLTDLQKRGVDVQRLGTDGGQALAKAVGELVGVEQQLDLWHELRRLGRAERAVEGVAYTAMETEWELEKKAREMDPRHAMGGYVWQRYQEAGVEAEKRVAEYDQLHLICLWAREAMEAVGLGRLRRPQECVGELQAASALLRQLQVHTARKLADHLDKAGPIVLRYVERLQAPVAALKAEMGEERVEMLCREWRLLREVGKGRRIEKRERQMAYQRAHLTALLHWGKGYGAAQAKVVGTLEGVMRGSSLAECVNSWLRPYADLRKGQGEVFLPLFMLYGNSHVFKRGKRAGHSPLELAGIQTPSRDWLDWLGFGRPRQPARSVRSLPKQTPAPLPAQAVPAAA